MKFDSSLRRRYVLVGSVKDTIDVPACEVCHVLEEGFLDEIKSLLLLFESAQE